MRIGWGTAVVFAVGLASAAAGAAPKNSFSAGLEKMPLPERAARLAALVGYWCVGTETFHMGTGESGPETGLAYWSVACLDGGSYAIQIDPIGRSVTIDCAVLAAQGEGKQCFKKF